MLDARRRPREGRRGAHRAIVATEPGDYVVKVDAKDDAGHDVEAASEIWVIGKGEAFWSGDEGDRMTLIASKPSYEIGDTARLVAQTNLARSPTALVTIERDGMLSTRASMKLDVVERRHRAADRRRVGAERVRVGRRSCRAATATATSIARSSRWAWSSSWSSAKAKQLEVAVELDRDHVEPGERVTGKIARDAAPARR